MDKLYPWQKNMLTTLANSKGELRIMMAGRNIGKSVFSAQALKRLMEDIQNRPVEDMILTEGRFAGARFYCVEPVGGSWMDMEVWCIKTFGPSAEVWELKQSNEEFMWPELGRWYKNDRKFWFRNERDRDWFIIKWRA